MTLFVGVVLTDTDYPTPFSFLFRVLDSTALDLWWPVGILTSFLAAPFSSLIIRYLESSMGRQFPGLGFLFLQTNHFFSSKISLIHSQKRLWEGENGGSVLDC